MEHLRFWWPSVLTATSLMHSTPDQFVIEASVEDAIIKIAVRMNDIPWFCQCELILVAQLDEVRNTHQLCVALLVVLPTAMLLVFM